MNKKCEKKVYNVIVMFVFVLCLRQRDQGGVWRLYYTPLILLKLIQSALNLFGKCFSHVHLEHLKRNCVYLKKLQK